MLINSREVEIEFGDCDPAGIVYYPNYFRMFDAATAHLFEAALGMKKIAWTQALRHRRHSRWSTPAPGSCKPSRFGDVVTISSTITGFKRSSFEVGHQAVQRRRCWPSRRARRASGPAADPDDPNKLKSVPLPDEVVAALSQGNQS